MVHLLRYTNLNDLLTDEQRMWLNGDENTIITHVKDRVFNDTRYALNIDKVKSLGWSDDNDFIPALQQVMRWYITEWKK